MKTICTLALLFLSCLAPSLTHALSPYDPAVDWAEFLFGPANMNAFVGCGGLSAGIAATGEITVLKYPSPSYHDQMCYFTLSRTLPRMGAKPNMGCFLGLSWKEHGTYRTSWLRDDPWHHQQRYKEDLSALLVTSHENEELGLHVDVEDFIVPQEDLLVRHVTLRRSSSFPLDESLRLILYENLDPCTQKIPFLPIQDWLLDAWNDYGLGYSSRRDALVHFRPEDPASPWETLLPLLEASPEDVDAFLEQLAKTGSKGVYFVFGSDTPSESFQCGRQDLLFPSSPWPQDAYHDALDGTLSRRRFSLRRANGALSWPISFRGDTAELTLYLAASSSAGEALRRLEEARRSGPQWYRTASRTWWADRLQQVRLPLSMDPTLVRVCKRSLISLLSSCDQRTGSLVASISPQPPYALDWPRDGAFMSHALDRAGFTDMVTRRNLWLAPLFRPRTGLVDMCFYSDGIPGGPLPYEIDNLALAIWSLWDHAGFFSEPLARLTYLQAVYPSIKAAAHFLVRCRDPQTGLQCPTMEGDRPWLSQELPGAAAARLGLEAAFRAGQALQEDPALLALWTTRSQELSQAIVSEFWDEDGETFGAGLLGCYLFWPYPLLPLQDPRMQAEAHGILDGIQSNLNKETSGGGYEPLALWMLAEQARGLGKRITDRIEEALLLFSKEIPTRGTLHVGEAYVTADLDGDGTLEFEPHAAQPQIPIASMIYLAAMALQDANSDEQSDPEDWEHPRGCGACGVTETCPPSRSVIPELLFLHILLVAHVRALKKLYRRLVPPPRDFH